MWAVTLAFNGLTTAGMGMVSFPAHMIGHALSALYDTPHGASLSIVLPAWMTYTSAKDPRKYARLAREVFGVCEADEATAADEGVKRLKGWFASIGSPTSLAACAITDSDIERLAANAYGLGQAWGLKEYTKEKIIDILQLCK
jgi:hypothetical protein